MTSADGSAVPLKLRVNGQERSLFVSPLTTLQRALHRDLGLREVRYGCGEGVCGACLVLLDGKPTASCIKLALQAGGCDVITATALETALPEAARSCYGYLRSNLESCAAFQCGYCACGFLVSAAHFLCGNEGPMQPDALRTALSGNLCRCTGYHQIMEAVSAAAEGKQKGDPLARRPDIVEKMGADAGYPTDRHSREALVGRILWSEQPSARIQSIDTTAARAVPGVITVLTCKDIPGENIGGTMTFAEDQPLLAADQVRSVADAVALVAATTEEAALVALKQIRVMYSPLPQVSGPATALAAGTPSLGRHGNLVSQFTEKAGDVATVFAGADLVVEGSYRCNSNDHACVELEGGSGWMENDTVVIELQSQSPYGAVNAVARQLAIPESSVRIVSNRMGGSFGKYLVAGLEGFLALLVYKTRQPVRLVLSREESFARRVKRHATFAQYKLGLKRDGSFTALDAQILADAGPYVSLTPAVTSLLTTEAPGGYEIANVSVDCQGILTNNLPGAPMRGFGSQQANFGIECLVDKAARELKMDPAELRRRNYKRETVSWSQTPVPNPWLTRTMDAVTAGLGQRPVANDEWLHGRGVGSAHAKYGYPSGLTDRFVARLRVDSSGQFVVESDIADAGSGSTHGVGKLVARTLNLDSLPTYAFSQDCIADPTGALVSSGSASSPFKMRVFKIIERIQTTFSGRLHALTSRFSQRFLAWTMQLTGFMTNGFNAFLGWLKSAWFPYSVDTFNPRISGSRGIFMLGRAAQQAAERMRELALTQAARSLGTDAGALELGSGGIFDRANPARRITWAELAQQHQGKLQTVGESHLPKGMLFHAATGNQVGPVDFVYASHGCDIAVDPATGKVKVLHYVASHDVGRVLDAEAVRGQLLGGIVMGISQALHEVLAIQNGQAGIKALHDYLVPTCLDVPENIDLHIIESGTGLGPDGAKGIGEIAAVVAPIAIANAVYDALGVQPTAIPITPEQIICELMKRPGVSATA
jgi:CO/xanthine dehydrogenase Mo-binding subunit/aerobic-type carbon monoxide dehydrogenase small subunit (CoxS/CutS family)